MKEKPILFSGSMVKAILEGRKTQTRRIIKPQPEDLIMPSGSLNDRAFNHKEEKAIYNVFRMNPGDQLWVRETFCLESNLGIEDETTYRPPFKDGRPINRLKGDDGPYWEQAHYRASDPAPELAYDDMDDPGCRWKPSIHMPRWASRIQLEVVKVRVERLQDISPEDCIEEGIADKDNTSYGARYTFGQLWESINAARDNGAYAWDKNPWVWVVEFKQIKKGE